MTHPFFAAEIARQRQESLRARVALARLRRRPPSTGEAEPAGVRWDALAERMAESGPRSLEVEVRAVLRAARNAGVEPALIEVLADADAPEVARQRAFGRIMRALVPRPRPERPSNVSSHDAA